MQLVRSLSDRPCRRPGRAALPVLPGPPAQRRGARRLPRRRLGQHGAGRSRGVRLDVAGLQGVLRGLRRPAGARPAVRRGARRRRRAGGRHPQPRALAALVRRERRRRRLDHRHRRQAADGDRRDAGVVRSDFTGRRLRAAAARAHRSGRRLQLRRRRPAAAGHVARAGECRRRGRRGTRSAPSSRRSSVRTSCRPRFISLQESIASPVQAGAARDGRRRSACCCSSPAPTRRICCSRAPRAAAARSRCVPRSAPAAAASSARCSPRASCCR